MKEHVRIIDGLNSLMAIPAYDIYKYLFYKYFNLQLNNLIYFDIDV